MLKNYIKIAWRNLLRHKSNTFINLMGLAVAMACCIMIALYAHEELSYDRFHENADRIVAVGHENSYFGPGLSTPYPLADAMKQEIPGVEQATRLKGSSGLNLSLDGQNFAEIESGWYTESSFFDVFSFNLLSGKQEKALEGPNQVVLTRGTSEKLFGDKNPVGESLYWLQQDTTKMLQVSGIIADPPDNSSLNFGALISFNTMPEGQRLPEGWRAYSHRTFALLNNPKAEEQLPGHFTTLVENHYEETTTEFFALPLTSLHLSDLSHDTGFTGNTKYLYLFGSVALFILLIACVNYINLSTARVSIRAKEVGIRKSLGAVRKQVAVQFLGESFLLSTGAYLLGIILAEIAIPFFDQLFGTNLSGSDTGLLLLWLGLGAMGVGFVAGVYPSFYLSGFTPSTILRNKSSTGSSGSLLRKGLVVGQFGIALVLIIGSAVIYKQLQYTQNKDLGFNGEQVVSLELPNRQTWQLRNIIRNNLAAYPDILEAAVVSGAPGDFNIRLGNKPEDLSPQQQAESEENIAIAPAVVDYNFIDLLDLKLLAGRNFSADLSTDLERGYILNRKTVELLGWQPEEAVGKSFNLSNEGEVIGVVENFHIHSLHRELEPVVLQLHEASSWSSGGILLARISPDRIPGTMDFIKSEMAKFAPYSSFEYEFLDEKFEAMYRTERRLANIITIFTFIAIFVACLGLYGLAAFAAERRTKEIGIRKVLGATVTNIVGLLSKDFLKLVLLGFVIAVPIAWYAMNRWLADFAYRIEIGVDIFLLAGGAAILIALATVSWQSARAALANPVESLRSE